MLPRNRNVVSLCYTLRDLYEVVIPRDETSIAQMCEKLDAFFRDAFKDALLNELFYRVN